MNSDISEEAKRAIADGARRRAADRLDRDGRHSPDAVRRRVLALAAERNLAPADYAKLLHKRISSSAAVDFCDKHKVSLDWLLSGDLQGLQRMTKEEIAPRSPPILTSDELRRAYESLGEKDRAFISQYLTPSRQEGRRANPGRVTLSGRPLHQAGGLFSQATEQN
jgi:hypothetical protein